MKSEKHILCNYKNGKMIFPDRTEIYDGEYVFIANRPEDFSIYKTEAFEDFQKRLFEARKKTDDKHLNMMARYILSRAVIVNVVNGNFEVPIQGWLEMSSEVFDTQVYTDHIRFISFERKAIYEEQKDIIKMTDSKITI